MSETQDWKAKYLASLRQMDAEEQRWQAAEKVLRRLVNRLCAAAMGQDEQLDDQLAKLAEANRRGAEVGELGARIDFLSDALKQHERSNTTRQPILAGGTTTLRTLLPGAFRPQEVTAPPPEPTAEPARVDASRTAALRLLDGLASSQASGPALAPLADRIRAASSDATLAAVLTEVAGVAAHHAREIAAERAAAALVLKQVTERLDEMAHFIAGIGRDRETQLREAAALDLDVMNEVNSLSRDAAVATDIRSLRSLVAERLDHVARQVREFHGREAQRLAEQANRSERLRARITELEKESRDLSRSLDLERRRSRLDPLTRIANRGAFEERINDELPRWRRFGAPVSLLLWDIDHFKLINDSYGHRVGDAVLREVATRLRTRIRTTDLVARYGGEEFAMLLVGTARDQAKVVADELRIAVAGLAFHFKGTPVAVTISCGITDLRQGDTPDSVIDRADRALYRAKDGGRNRIEVD